MLQFNESFWRKRVVEWSGEERGERLSKGQGEGPDAQRTPAFENLNLITPLCYRDFQLHNENVIHSSKLIM